MSEDIFKPIELIEPIDLSMEIGEECYTKKFCNEGYICVVGEVHI